uniref:GST N-terminal domain-containing protein n=1 Tax=Rhinolophus ferrumequinum TaxID=59479 RepID=A0A671DJ84_RHIFE
MAMTLGYWDIRRWPHAIRLLLEYTASHYEKKYTMGDIPDCDRSQWLSAKFRLGLDFLNLLPSFQWLLWFEESDWTPGLQNSALTSQHCPEDQ